MSEPSTRPEPELRHAPVAAHRPNRLVRNGITPIFVTSLITFYITISISLFIIPTTTATRSAESSESALTSEHLMKISRPILESSGDDLGEDGGSGDDNELVLTSREVKAIDLEIFKKQLLRRMGLNGRPAAIDRDNVLPIYLWDIYDNVADGNPLSATFDFLAPENEADRAATDESNDNQFSPAQAYYDTVRTFFATGNPLWPTTLLFDIHRLPSNERWVEAELRVPWHDMFIDEPGINETRSDKNDNVTSSEYESRKHYVRINLYEVINETVDIRNLIDTKLINAGLQFRPWTNFDVLSIVSRASIKLNLVKLAVEFVDSSKMIDSKFLNVINNDDDRSVENSPALIMYGFDDDGKEKPIKYKRFHQDGGARRKRQIQNNKKRASSRPRLRGSDSTIGRHSTASARRSGQQQNLCQRRPLIIRFEDLNWQDWILAPQEYAAFYCTGQCVYPFADGQNSTNHAIVQALVNSVSPRTAPRPCCVATETSSISMLYTDSDKNIVIKNYPDMIVEGCGCR